MEVGLQSSAKLFLLLVSMVILVSQQASAATAFRNETDRLALLEFKNQISADPHGLLSSWNASQHHCQWPGIACNTRHQRVTSLNLRGKSLFGSISPWIGNLSFLMSIQLGENRFHGAIPQEIGRLFRLKYLNLSTNTLNGEIPINLSHCSELRYISLRSNGIIGKIPSELSSLQKLEEISLARNNLTGEIPHSLGNISSLQYVSIAINNLEGSLPDELGLLMNLTFLSVSENRLTGAFPPSLFNISSLATLSVTLNSLEGNLPMDIGLKMQNLQQFAIGGNQFSGNIPVSISNATKLEVFDIPRNKFEGQVPTNLGNLPNLQWLNLANNFLGRNSAQDLDFIASLTNCTSLEMIGLNNNSFGGELPSSIANLSSQFQILLMGGNNISGTIPVGLGNIIGLNRLALEFNSFSGTTPNDFGKFQNLQLLSLGNNLLSGLIPSNLDNITSLYHLELQGNSFEGPLPPSLRNCRNLQIVNISRNNLTGVLSPLIFGMSFSPRVLDLSHNLLTGAMPPEVGRLEDIDTLDLSFNKFSGEIPESISDCSKLQNLSIQGNLFAGLIPPKLSFLKLLQSLDLSRNNLTGQIPADLASLTFLEYLNLSFNDLEGEIPTQGVFANASLAMLAGNNKLCGGIPELGLPPCLIQRKKNVKLPIIITMSIVGAVIVISGVIFSYCQKKDKINRSSSKSSRVDEILKVSYHELYRATEGFSPENLVGSGSFGFVYRGKLKRHGDRLVAVKVIHLQRTGASKSFNAECRALRNIRHRNLLAILTSCSSIDLKGNEFKALVYEFMENGSLDGWLHLEPDNNRRSKNLDLLQRLNIAIDVASALHYLHNDCETTVVHCDLKPSNILLDNDLTAQVGDFGLAKLLHKTTESSSEQGTSSTIAIKGSIGYAAPEYGMGSEASPQGDVYSFGILLFEIFTGRRPTNEIFTDGLDLHSYVKMNLPGQVLEITDPLLVLEEGEENRDGTGNVQKCLISLFSIGLKCSETVPNDRMHMNEVLRQLQLIRDVFTGAKRIGVHS